MSVLGERAAVIALGYSCQPAGQIREQITLLRELTGDPTLEPSGFPWDWLVTPPPALPALLGWPPPFPPREEITLRGRSELRPWWERNRVVYRHAFFKAGRHWVDDLYQAAQQRHDHTVGKLRRLPPQVTAILSNTQRDYGYMLDDADAGAPEVEEADLRKTAEAFRGLFGTTAKLVFVTHPELYRGGAVEGVHTIIRPPDAHGSHWFGSHEAWADVFRQALAEPAAIP